MTDKQFVKVWLVLVATMGTVLFMQKMVEKDLYGRTEAQILTSLNVSKTVTAAAVTK